MKNKACVSANHNQLTRVLLPSVMESMLIGVAAAVETALVGRLGERAVAALGLTLQPRLISITVFTGINAAVCAAGSKEAKKQHGMSIKWLYGVIPIVLLLSIFVSIVFTIWPERILMITGGSRVLSEAEILQSAAAYLRYYSMGFPLLMLAQCICACLRGCGRAWSSFLISAIGSAVQTCSCILLLTMRKTVAKDVRFCGIAYVAGACTMLFFALAILILVIQKCGGSSKTKPSVRTVLMGMIPVALWVAFEQIGIRIGYVLSGRMLFSMGTVMYAANQICQQVASLTYAVGDGFASGGTAMAGNGQGGYKRERAIAKKNIVVSLLASGLLGGALLFAAPQIVELFMRPNSQNTREVVYSAAAALKAFSVFIPLQCGALMINGMMRADGRARQSALISVLSAGIVRPVMMMIAARIAGERLWIVWMLTSTDQALKFLLLMYVQWKQKRHTACVP